MTDPTSSPENPSINILGNGPPYILGNIVGNAIAQRIANAEKGRLHVETFLCAMGALAGFSAQMGLREELIGKEKKTEKDIFTIFSTNNNIFYYGGPTLGALLTDTPRSIFQVVGGALQTIFGTTSVSIEMASKLVRTVASESDAEYGLLLDVPSTHNPHLRPLELLKVFWNQAYAELHTMSELSGKVKPTEWAYELAFCLYNFLLPAKTILPPCEVAFELIMRPAIAMGRINPDIIIQHIKENKLEWKQLGCSTENIDYPIYR